MAAMASSRQSNSTKAYPRIFSETWSMGILTSLMCPKGEKKAWSICSVTVSGRLPTQMVRLQSSSSSILFQILLIISKQASMRKEIEKAQILEIGLNRKDLLKLFKIIIEGTQMWKYMSFIWTFVIYSQSFHKLYSLVYIIKAFYLNNSIPFIARRHYKPLKGQKTSSLHAQLHSITSFQNYFIISSHIFLTLILHSYANFSYSGHKFPSDGCHSIKIEKWA